MKDILKSEVSTYCENGERISRISNAPSLCEKIWSTSKRETVLNSKSGISSCKTRQETEPKIKRLPFCIGCRGYTEAKYEQHKKWIDDYKRQRLVRRHPVKCIELSYPTLCPLRPYKSKYNNKDIFSLIISEIKNRMGQKGGKGSIVNRDKWLDPPVYRVPIYKVGFLGDLTVNRIKRPQESISTENENFKFCPDCKKYKNCETLCSINALYANQDRVYDSNLSYLYGPILEDLAEDAPFTFSEFVSIRKAKTPKTKPSYLTQLEFDVYTSIYIKKRTFKETGRAYSISTQRVKTLNAAAQRKLFKYHKGKKDKVEHAPKMPNLPFCIAPKIIRLSKEKERGISRIDKKCGTNYRYWYNHAIRGHSFDFICNERRIYDRKSFLKWCEIVKKFVYPPHEKDEDLKCLLKTYLPGQPTGRYWVSYEPQDDISKQFWKNPVAKVFLTINRKSGRCYYKRGEIAFSQFGDNDFEIKALIDNTARKIPTGIKDLLLLCCPNCKYRITEIIENYIKNIDARKCANCGCILVIDYGPWCHGTSAFDGSYGIDHFKPSPEDPKYDINYDFGDKDYTNQNLEISMVGMSADLKKMVSDLSEISDDN